MSVFHRWILI